MNKVKPNMAMTRGATLLVSLAFLLTLTGCFGVDGQFRHLRDTVFEGTGVEYTVESEFALGSFVLGVAGKIARISDDEEARIAQELLREIKGVQIGAYNLQNFKLSKEDTHRKAREVISFMRQYDYDSIIRNYDGNGISLVMVRMSPDDPERISDFVVLDFNDVELNLVQLRGDLAKIVDIATREGEMPEEVGVTIGD